MFRGVYEHHIDPKGRTSLPAKLRETLVGAYDERLIVTTALDACLHAYPVREWEPLVVGADQRLPELGREARSPLRVDVVLVDAPEHTFACRWRSLLIHSIPLLSTTDPERGGGLPREVLWAPRLSGNFAVRR